MAIPSSHKESFLTPLGSKATVSPRATCAEGAACLCTEPGRRAGVLLHKSCARRKRAVLSSYLSSCFHSAAFLWPGLELARSDPARPVQHCPTNQHLKSISFSTSLVEAEGLMETVDQGGQRHKAGGLEYWQRERQMACYLDLTMDWDQESWW